MKKEKFSIMTYIKLGFGIALYFYLYIISGYRTWHGIKYHEDIMNPLMGLVFCTAIALYILLGKKGKPNPLDKKVSPLTITLVMLLFFSMVEFVYWYSRN